MSIALIAGIALAFLGLLLVLVWQLPEVIEKAKKKRQKVSVPPPEKDWKGIAERFEKRVKTQESDLQAAERRLREKDRQLGALGASRDALQKQLDQEKTWIAKEEAELKKEKKLEFALKEDLARTREALNTESTERIKIEYELKDFRRVKEELASTGRSLASRVQDLERQLGSALQELKQLREENGQLQKKKEDTEWVARSDYKQLEAVLKRTRIELEDRKNKEKLNSLQGPDRDPVKD